MPLEFIAAPLLLIVGRAVFGHFETHTPGAHKALKWRIYFGLVVLLTLRAGRPWSLIWTFGLGGAGLVFHFIWCALNGIHPLTSEPRQKYLALRGWTNIAHKRA